MPDPIQPIPTDAIDEAALARDRTAADPQALDELKQSIVASGLRMPIEVFELAEPDGPHRYGLISGFRRLAAFRALTAWGLDGYTAIPAFVRAPASHRRRDDRHGRGERHPRRGLALGAGARHPHRPRQRHL